MAACSPRRVRAPTPRAISRRSTVPSLPDGGQRPGRTTSRWARRSASSPRFPTDRFCRTRNQSGSLLSTVPEAPSAEQLLALLAERDAMTVELAGRVAELEARLGKHSQDSPKPPCAGGYAKPEPRSFAAGLGPAAGQAARRAWVRVEAAGRPGPDRRAHPASVPRLRVRSGPAAGGRE